MPLVLGVDEEVSLKRYFQKHYLVCVKFFADVFKCWYKLKTAQDILAY